MKTTPTIFVLKISFIPVFLLLEILFAKLVAKSGAAEFLLGIGASKEFTIKALFTAACVLAVLSTALYVKTILLIVTRIKRTKNGPHKNA